MKLEPRIGPDGRDDDITRALRKAYAAPAGEAFWEQLERKILARVAAVEEDGWWKQVAGWRRGLAVACAAAFLVAAFVTHHSNRERSLAAYRAIETARIAPVQISSETDAETSRDVTLRYVMGP